MPLKLVYFETFDRIDFAFDREKQVQKWSRAKKIALIKKDFDLLKKLAKNKSKQEPKVGELTEPYYGELVEPYFGEYPPDFFDFIIIDECHRGGANDESAWRDIMEYFSPAVQLGLTATPKRKQNIDTYKYFGEPVYIYSLKQGINDGFLTPFKVRQIDTTIDEYIYTSDDTVIEGEIEEGKRYTEEDMNRVIEIRQREEYRVKLFMGMINQDEKTLVFCASQLHALAIRDLVNQFADSKNPNYCHRVTADDGKLGEQHLSEFQDNEKIIPTILTTSQKLSTGVDTPEVKNIVLLRPVKQLIEFKQIIGRGTRLYDGKDYFTIYDFVKAHYNFSDPEWDGEPLEPEMPTVKNPKPYSDPVDPGKTVEESDSPKKMIKVKLPDGKVREFQHIVKTSFWSPDGKPISAEEFLQNLFGTLPEFFKNEDELRKIWSKPDTRKKLLVELNEKGISKSQLNDLQKMIHAEKSDLFDVLAYVAFSSIPLERSARAEKVKIHFNNYDSKQQIFLDFVLKQYVNSGVEELDDEKLPNLLELKYSAITDAKKELGDITSIRNTFIGFQPYLYDNKIAI
ncbi:MAG: DEAD/DEAH box helicase family protein [Bacteroidia bacterium]|nr:DEAD/DEAH box helicase family protein [Bacteroidia bacterium]